MNYTSSNYNFLESYSIDSNTVFMYGNKQSTIPGIVRTTDGGKTWKEIFDLSYLNTWKAYMQSSAYDFQNLAVVSNSHYYFAGTPKRIAMTSDSGATWNVVQLDNDRDSNNRVFRLYMSDSLSGIIWFFPNYYYVTKDGWKTWERDSVVLPSTYPVGNFFQKLKIVSVDTVYSWMGPRTDKNNPKPDTTHPARYIFARTYNRGVTWEYDTVTQQSAYGMNFISSKIGWAITNIKTGNGDEARNLVYRTTDAGKHWDKQLDSVFNDAQTNTAQFEIYGMNFLDERNGILIGNSKILSTTNGGVTWVTNNHNTPLGYSPWYGCVKMISPTRAFIGSTKGFIMRWDAYDTATTTSVKEEEIVEGNGLRLYPSPATTRVTLGFDEGLQSESTITIYDEIGRSVLQTHAEQGTIQMEVEVHNLQNGVYSLLVSNKAGVKTLPFVVSR
ncbi:MAG: T9SS type A sorting domain-containing protein [Candidatus Kapaibacterium sp.]